MVCVCVVNGLIWGWKASHITYNNNLCDYIVHAETISHNVPSFRKEPMFMPKLTQAERARQRAHLCLDPGLNGQGRKWRCNTSFLFLKSLICLCLLFYRSLLSLYFSIEICNFFLLFFWNHYTFSLSYWNLYFIHLHPFLFTFLYWSLYFLCTSLLRSPLSHHFSNEISTSLCTFLLKSEQSLYFSFVITTFSLLFYWNLYTFSVFLHFTFDSHSWLLSNFHIVPRLPHKALPPDLGIQMAELRLDWAVQLTQLPLGKASQLAELRLDWAVQLTELHLDKAIQLAELRLDWAVQLTELHLDKAIQLAELRLDWAV